MGIGRYSSKEDAYILSIDEFNCMIMSNKIINEENDKFKQRIEQLESRIKELESTLMSTRRLIKELIDFDTMSTMDEELLAACLRIDDGLKED